MIHIMSVTSPQYCIVMFSIVWTGVASLQRGNTETNTASLFRFFSLLPELQSVVRSFCTAPDLFNLCTFLNPAVRKIHSLLSR